MNAAALFFVTHGSRDPRSWSALQSLVAVAQNLYPQNTDPDRLISGGCLEGLELSLAQQLIDFAIMAIAKGVSEIIIVPLFLLDGVHVSADIPEQVAIAQTKLSGDRHKLTLRTTAHLGTDLQIPDLLLQQFENYQKVLNGTNHEINREINHQIKYGRIVMAHGSRREGANQVVEDLASHSQAIAAYWGVEPKIETQIELLLAQGIDQIQVLPYFLTEGGITEAIANKLKPYSDRTHQLPVPLSHEMIINLSLTFTNP
jgi:sirohydrochlorin ferrochelatase